MPRQTQNTPNKKEKKRDKKVLNLAEKIKILNALAAGEKVACLARKFNVNESTIRSIRANERKIRESAKCLGKHAEKCKITRSPHIEKMEDMLIIWLQDAFHKRIPMSGDMIRAQALNYYNHIQKSSANPSGDKFAASRGWFDRFRQRFSLHNVAFAGENASADQEAARKFPTEVRALISEKGYVASQIFNCDETGLFWKQMPKRTYLMKEEKTSGFKVAKERYIFFFGNFQCFFYECICELTLLGTLSFSAQMQLAPSNVSRC